MAALCERYDELGLFSRHQTTRFRELAYQVTSSWELLGVQGDRREAFLVLLFGGLRDQVATVLF